MTYFNGILFTTDDTLTTEINISNKCLVISQPDQFSEVFELLKNNKIWFDFLIVTDSNKQNCTMFYQTSQNEITFDFYGELIDWLLSVISADDNDVFCTHNAKKLLPQVNPLFPNLTYPLTISTISEIKHKTETEHGFMPSEF
jgi:hypothetical protein